MNIHISSSSRLSPQGGSGRLDTFLHSILSSTLSRSTTLPSSRTQPIHHFLRRPLLLVPGSLRSADHLTNSFSSILFTCPYHLSLHSRIFSQFHHLQFLPYEYIYIYIYIYIWWLACHWTYSPTYYHILYLLLCSICVKLPSSLPITTMNKN